MRATPPAPTSYLPRPRTPPTTRARFGAFRPAVAISIPLGRRPPLGTLFDTLARLMPSTSPTCFFAERGAAEALLAVFFRVEAAPRDVTGAALLRVPPALRGLEDVIFFAKLPPVVALRRDVQALYLSRRGFPGSACRTQE